MQGDVFDSQRDMTCAIVGAVFSMALTAIAQYEGQLPDDPRPAIMERDHDEHSVQR